MCADKTDWHVQCSSSLQGLEIGSLLLLHAVPFLLERHLSTIPPARKHKVMITLVKSTVYIKMFCVILRLHMHKQNSYCNVQSKDRLM